MSLDEEPDSEMQNNILDVRKAIEKSTSKVSLRDLEKKGFRKVKVLRAGDINQLIFKAVQTVLAKQAPGMGEAERAQVLAEAKAEYEKNVKQLQQAQQALDKVEQEKEAVDAKAREVEEAKKRLEQKVAELNTQLSAEKRKMEADKAAFAEEKKQLDREKQNLFEKGMDAVKGSQQQVAQAEQRAVSLQARVRELEAEVERVKSEPKSDPEEIASMRAEMEVAKEKAAAQSAQAIEAFGAVMNAIGQMKAQPVAAGVGGDWDKRMKAFELNLGDQLRKFAGAAQRGGWDEGSTVDLAALMARQTADDVKLETNIKDVGVKQQTAAGVKDKLSRLKNMRGGGGSSPAP
ncbi:hypothetical protein HY251_06630 [bacterium]|nr:hypothetical protein [bacterium]